MRQLAFPSGSAFIALPNFLPLLQYLFAAYHRGSSKRKSYHQDSSERYPVFIPTFSTFTRSREFRRFLVFNGRCSPLPRPFRGTLISSIDSRQKAGASFAIQFSIQKKTTCKNLRWQKAEDDFERSSVFFRRTSQVGAVHAKIEGFGEQREQKGTRHSFRFIARAHKKTGARPSVASRLSLGHPRPWKRTRKSRPDANVADFSIRNR